MLKEENKKTATGQNDEACYTFQGVCQNFKLMGSKEKINENFIILKIIEFILAFSPNDGFENPFLKIVGFAEPMENILKMPLTKEASHMLQTYARVDFALLRRTFLH